MTITQGSTRCHGVDPLSVDKWNIYHDLQELCFYIYLELRRVLFHFEILLTNQFQSIHLDARPRYLECIVAMCYIVQKCSNGCNRSNKNDAVILMPKYQLKAWDIPWYGPKCSFFFHLNDAGNIGFFKKRTFTTRLMRCDSALYFHYNVILFIVSLAYNKTIWWEHLHVKFPLAK